MPTARRRRIVPPWSMRIEILKSAACAFRRLGYHGATVEQIAAVLHMKKGNLYYYFRNKEEILFACHQVLARSAAGPPRRDRATRPRPRRKTPPADRRLRPHDSRRTARHGAVSRSRGAESGAPEGGHRPPRSVRSRHASSGAPRDPRRPVRADGCEAALVRNPRRCELDPALVQPRGSGELSTDRRSIRRLPHRRPPAG